MTDRELKAKILAEIERLKANNDHIQHGDLLENRDRSIRYNLLEEFSDFIDSLPEEHPYKTGDKVWYLNELYDLEDDGRHYILTSVRNYAIVHLNYGDEDFKLRPYKKPVSSDLEEAVEECISNLIPEQELNAATPFLLEFVITLLHKAFKAGAQWQKLKIIHKAIIYNDKVYPTTYEDEPTEFCLDGGEEVRLITESVNNGLLKQGDKVKVIIIKDE